MFKWLKSIFCARKQEMTININLNVSGSVECEETNRRDTYKAGFKSTDGINSGDVPSNLEIAAEMPSADRFKRLKKPKVKFGSEK